MTNLKFVSLGTFVNKIEHLKSRQIESLDVDEYESLLENLKQIEYDNIHNIFFLNLMILFQVIYQKQRNTTYILKNGISLTLPKLLLVVVLIDVTKIRLTFRIFLLYI